MQETETKTATTAVELKDTRLFREACYVDGQWVQAKSGSKTLLAATRSRLDHRGVG